MSAAAGIATTYAVGRPRRRRGLGPSVWLAIVPIAVMAALAVYPLMLVLSHAFQAPDGARSLEAWRTLFANPVFRDTIWTTVRVSVISTAICILVGTFLALVMAFVPFRGVSLVVNAINVYLSFPSFLITLALIFVWGNVGVVNGVLHNLGTGSAVHLLDGQWGVVLAEVIFFTPFVIRPMLAACESTDYGQLEMAAALGARPVRIVRSIILPEIMPALLAGGSLVLMRTMNEFGIVLFTGAKDVVTLPTLVYTQAIARGNYTYAAIAAIVNIGLSVVLYVAYRSVTARAVGGRHAR